MSFSVIKGTIKMEFEVIKQAKPSLNNCPFPFDKMEVGDYFVIPVTVSTLDKWRSSVYSWKVKWRRAMNPAFNLHVTIVGDALKVRRFN